MKTKPLDTVSSVSIVVTLIALHALGGGQRILTGVTLKEMTDVFNPMRKNDLDCEPTGPSAAREASFPCG